MYSPSWAEGIQVAIALGLLGLSIPCLAAAYALVIAEWRAADATSRRLLIGAVAIAAVLRWSVFPRWLAMVFIGYAQTQRAIDLLPLGHYGAGATALYHALFSVLPHDHRYLMAANSVIGVATIPLSASVAARLFNAPRTGALVALAVATTPLFIRNDNSEANNVPMLWWLFGGALLWLEYREKRSTIHAVQAACLFALAAIARPEAPLLVALIVAVSRLVEPPARSRAPDRLELAIAGVVGLIVVPHVFHVIRAANSLGLGRPSEFLIRSLNVLSLRNVLIDPRLFPVGLAGLAVFGAVRRVHAASRLLLGATAIALVLYAFDLDRGNMARAEVPAAVFATFAACAAAARLLQDRPRAGGLVLGAAFASSVVTIPFVWARTNEQAEDEFIREAVATLPREPRVFVRHAFDDLNRPGSAGYTQQHFPDYLVDRFVAPGAIYGIEEFRTHPDFSVPVFFFWGVRCSARFRPEHAPRPHGEIIQPACAEMRKSFRLEPVIEKTIENRGDVWLEYYSDAPTMRLGLYRVRPLIAQP